ncbi:hypothetical protein PMAA_084330 [Paecilomyces variotii No. 5]|uniref:Zn(2)-C6 fungal-type domain-containing protein n=1 Tax=Byssochlamys spectabilis (strain No. 5 / NBRC 109023) TaxID=1356009 RepID=V5FJ13_BYSSN|nr:hypothetical protein PMAA_084330 [Paecilomyces variotii No. 5]
MELNMHVESPITIYRREAGLVCDRAKPCGACCARGLESECQYTTNNEERFQIGQAETIENLRRQVRELKKLLGEIEQPAQPSSDRDTGSGDLQVEAYRPYVTSEEASQAAFSSSSPESPGLVFQSGAHDAVQMPASDFQSSYSDGTPPIGLSYGQPGMIPPPPVEDHWSQQHPRFPAPSAYADQFPLIPSYQHIAPAPDTSNILQDPERWKGKTVILQEILDMISACDDSRISSLLHIIRTSPTPEEAFVSIYRSIQ